MAPTAATILLLPLLALVIFVFVTRRRPVLSSFVAIIAIGIIYSYRHQMRHRLYLLYGFGGLFIMGLGIRALVIR